MKPLFFKLQKRKSEDHKNTSFSILPYNPTKGKSLNKKLLEAIDDENDKPALAAFR